MIKKIIPILLLSLLVDSCTETKSQESFNMDMAQIDREAVEEVIVPEFESEPVILIIPPQEDLKPVTIHTVKVDIKVTANLAVTTHDITFYNPNGRVLEGTLEFPLAEGQSISRFAMDVNGRLREGVIVEKAKGRKVFEEIERRNVDPGLLEKTKGNSYKARVYPIPANGYKRIVIAYEHELVNSGASYLYMAHLNYKYPLKSFSVRTEVFKQPYKPEFKKNELENFEFKNWNESYIAEAEYKDYKPDNKIAFIVPKDEAGQNIFVEEKNGKNYFYVNLQPEIKHTAKQKPGKICLFVDVSGSAEKKNIKKEIDVLNRYFKEIGNAEVEMIQFSNDIIEKKKFNINAGNLSDLTKELENLVFDGGTQLGALDFSKYNCDEIILLSDGLSNFGDPKIKLSNTPVYTINSSPSANHSYLKYIAKQTGGRYLNLNTLTSDQSAVMLKSTVFSFISAEYDENISELYPGNGAPVVNNFSLAGIMKSQKAKIKLNFGSGGKVSYSREIEIDKNKHGSNSGLIPRIWAQKKIAELDIFYDDYQSEILDLAQEFTIVTRNTSLIVLETLEDYLEYRIVPPDELKKDYLARINEMKSDKDRQQKEKIETVLAMFNERVKWWETEFKFGKRKDIENKGIGTGSAEEPLRSRENTEESFEEPRPVNPDMEVNDVSSGFSENRVMAAEPEKKEMNGGEKTSGSITLKKWDPDTPYLKKLKNTGKAKWYAVYLNEKKEYGNSSAYYLDVADFFMEKGNKELSLRILSNIAEMELENHQLLRILGYRLKQLGYYHLAEYVFNEVLKIREEEPQSYRDLALVYELLGKYQESVDMFYQVVIKLWDGRFPGIEVIALNEMNKVIATCGKELDLKAVNKRFIKNMPVDMRVVLTWDADNTDIDLWVTDPNGEKCLYSNNRTYIGGFMTSDFTQGYGPEVFLLKKAQPGKYIIEANYYGNSQQVLAGATTIQMELIIGYATGHSKTEEVTLRLKDNKEVVMVGEFEYK